MRFFHKFCSMNYIFLVLLTELCLASREKQSITEQSNIWINIHTLWMIWKYCRFRTNIQTKFGNAGFKVKKICPRLSKKCTETVNKFHSDRVIFLDNNNIFDYVEFPDYVIDKYRKGIISHANFSDMLRLALIA